MVEALDAICKEHELMEAVIRAGDVSCLLTLGEVGSGRQGVGPAHCLCPRWTVINWTLHVKSEDEAHL